MNLNYDESIFTFAFKFNLRPSSKASAGLARARSGGWEDALYDDPRGFRSGAQYEQTVRGRDGGGGGGRGGSERPMARAQSAGPGGRATTARERPLPPINPYAAGGMGRPKKAAATARAAPSRPAAAAPERGRATERGRAPERRAYPTPAELAQEARDAAAAAEEVGFRTRPSDYSLKSKP